MGLGGMGTHILRQVEVGLEKGLDGSNVLPVSIEQVRLQPITAQRLDSVSASGRSRQGWASGTSTSTSTEDEVLDAAFREVWSLGAKVW